MKKSLRILLLLGLAVLLALSTASIAFAQTGTGTGAGEACDAIVEGGKDSYFDATGGFYISGLGFVPADASDGEQFQICAIPSEDDTVAVWSEFAGTGVACFVLEPGDDGSNAFVAVEFPGIGVSVRNPVIYGDYIKSACINLNVSQFNGPDNPLQLWLIND